MLQIGYAVFYVLREEYHLHSIDIPIFLVGVFAIPGYYLAALVFGVGIRLFDPETPILHAKVFGCNLIVLLLAYTFVVVLIRLLYRAIQEIRLLLKRRKTPK